MSNKHIEKLIGMLALQTAYQFMDKNESRNPEKSALLLNKSLKFIQIQRLLKVCFDYEINWLESKTVVNFML